MYFVFIVKIMIHCYQLPTPKKNLHKEPSCNKFITNRFKERGCWRGMIAETDEWTSPMAVDCFLDRSGNMIAL